MGKLEFVTGHGTRNDFVLLPDADGTVGLTAELVTALCDRRAGIGADGVLRVIRSAKHPDAVRYAGDAEWFMDYWNADGSVAEMCGNGLRVYSRYLLDAGLITGERFTVATRSGVCPVRVTGGEIAVGLEVPRLLGPSVATADGREYPGTAVTTGNPHLVCLVDDLAPIDLSAPPGHDPAVFPDGVNVEFVEAAGSWQSPLPRPLRVRMRVYERGAGETESCGSGACAVAAVVLRRADQRSAGTVIVDVPGGRLTVTLDADRCWLGGPAVLVARGTVDPRQLPR